MSIEQEEMHLRQLKEFNMHLVNHYKFSKVNEWPISGKHQMMMVIF